MTATCDLLVRTATATDQVFVVSSWLQTYSTSDWAKQLRGNRQLKHYAKYLDPGRNRPDPYYPLHRAAIMDCLGRPQTVTLVAYHPDAPEELWGWACGQPGVCLHYVCVKPAYQGHGVAKLLTANLGFRPGEDCMVTHQPSGQLPAGWRLRPDLMFGTTNG